MALTVPALSQTTAPIGVGAGAGGGGGGGSGTVTSICTTNPATGGSPTCITTSGTIGWEQLLSLNSPVTASSYAIQGTTGCTSSQCDGYNLLTLGSGASALTIAQAGTTGFASGVVWTINNQSGGSVTLTPTTSTIDGSSSKTIASGCTLGFQSDGTNYHSTQICGSGGSSFANPSATAGPSANNGVATTAMRSDATPAVQKASSSQFGLTEPDGCTITTASGVTSAFSDGSDCFTGASSLWVIAAFPGDVAVGSSGLNASVSYCYPFSVSSTRTVDTLGQVIVTLGTSNDQLAIYANDITVSPYRPGLLLANTGNIANTGTGAVNGAITGPSSITQYQLTPGIYWACSQADDGTVRVAAVNDTSTVMGAAVGSLTQANLIGSAPATLVNVTFVSTFGTWPSNLHDTTFTEVGATLLAKASIVEYRILSQP